MIYSFILLHMQWASTEHFLYLISLCSLMTVQRMWYDCNVCWPGFWYKNYVSKDLEASIKPYIHIQTDSIRPYTASFSLLHSPYFCPASSSLPFWAAPPQTLQVQRGWQKYSLLSIPLVLTVHKHLIRMRGMVCSERGIQSSSASSKLMPDIQLILAISQRR